MLIEGTIAMAGTFASMIFAYLFHLFMVRMLPEAVYGDLSLCISFYMIFQMAFCSVQTILARDVAKLESKRKEKLARGLFAEYFQLGLAAGAITGIGIVLLLPLATHIFGESVRTGVLALCVVMPPTYIAIVLRGWLQGKERIVPLSVSVALQALGQFVSAVLFVAVGLGLTGAVLSMAVGFGICVLVLPGPVAIAFTTLKERIISAKKKKRKEKEKKARGTIADSRSRKSLIAILVTNVLLTVFLYLDLIVVRALRPPEDAGYYNVAGITSKVLYFAVIGLVLALLPKSSKLVLGRDSKAVKRLLTISFLLLAPIILLFMTAPEFVIRVFFTSKYLPAVGTFRILTVGMSLFSAFLILVNILWSQNEEKLPLVLSIIAIVMDAALLAWLVPSWGLEGAATATLICSAVLFVPAAIAVFMKMKAKRSAKTI